MFLLLNLASTFFYLIKVGLEASQSFLALHLLPSSSVLLLGVALPEVVLFFAICCIEAIADIGADLPLSEFSTLEKTLNLLLFLDV